ncbi:hypothetical protein PRIPAC_96218 [Pristionchus pacificus]|uniref:Uncharacterized protein n=1 Tax=Pristionchus pacificus TaxID=54126 RepID=A0A2A6BDP5_PRIPA|nr:hypothetical protein PRIPAC_96218 [Pristionchus pacificus]|eukprot:PDM64002.1 hypothetical protein PRIPAC_49503 [Pristionchus pacificus]
MSLKRTSRRDTARDIILGTAPSGRGPRAPKGGIANHDKQRSHSSDGILRRSQSSDRHRPRSEYPRRQPSQPRPDTRAVDALSKEIDRLKRQNRELLEHEKSARKRLEENQDRLHQKIRGGASARDVDDLKKYIGVYEKELARLSKDLQNRPQVDPNKIANATSQIDGRVKELQGQLSGLRQLMDKQQGDRERESRVYAENLSRMQENLRAQEKSKNDGVNSLARKFDADKEKLQDDNRRLAERLNATTNEVSKAVQDVNLKMKAEMDARNSQVEHALRAQSDNQAAFERDIMKQMSDQIQAQQKTIEALAQTIQSDRTKYKDRFTKVNEALAALEHHLELGNKKIDKIVNAEIQSRKLHEKGLLQKVSGVEEKLNNYISGINKSIDDVKAGKENVKMPNLDVDALRREMESIAADKNKLSMEGLLMLEEKISGMQTGLAWQFPESAPEPFILGQNISIWYENITRFTRDKREVADRIAGMNETSEGTGKKVEEKTDSLKTQLNKLDMLHDDMEKAQERIRDKVERQIPQDLNELSAKADNIKHQMNTRIDKEEEERYLAIRELQEAFSKLQTQAAIGGRDSSATVREASSHNESMRRDVDECKVAIKKLAESIATVKNVLDKKINTEIRQREHDVATINQRINTINTTRDTNRDTTRTAVSDY